MKKLKTGNKHKGKYQLVIFFDIMEFTADRIDNDKIILPSLLNLFSMFKIKCRCNLGEVDKNTAKKNL